MFEAHKHMPLILAAMTLVFLGIVSFMLIYNKQSKARQKSLENHGIPVASKEAGIMEAQESMKHDRQQK